MKKPGVIIYAIVVFLLAAAVAGIGGPRPATGSFDIEKVRQAASEGGGQLDFDTGRATAAPAGKPESIGWIAARICFYLALIAAAIVFLAWLIKRLEALPIGPNRAILMVRVKDAVFVLGQTQNQITLLDKAEGERAMELISSSKGGFSVTQFKDALDGFMGKIKKPL